MSSVIWGDAQSALYDLLSNADLSESDVQVFWGYDPDQAHELAVFVGYEEEDERDFEVLAGTIGGPPAAAPLDESFRNQIVVEARLAAGTDLKAAYDYASAIASKVEDALRADLTLGGICRFSRVQRVRRKYFRDSENRGARVFIDVVGEARF